MQDAVYDLYQSRPYPAASHPSTDPTVTAVAAKLAGLEVADPAKARILEIGCAAGHNLLPLAARWPDCQCTGLDFSKTAILDAKDTANRAGLRNIEFINADLRDFRSVSDTGFDYIIAHGVYSWVNPDVRQALLDLCASHLTPSGVALISYNTLPGWSLRKSIVETTRMLSCLGDRDAIGSTPEHHLGMLAMAAGNHNSYARHLTTVLHDMFGNTGGGLPFDDFSPINDPCTFLDFHNHTTKSGLRYLGESELDKNFPSSLATEAAGHLSPLASDKPALQQVIDLLTNRTFRSSLLCREDAPISPRISASIVNEFSIRCRHLSVENDGRLCLIDRSGKEMASFDDLLSIGFFRALAQTNPESVAILDLIGRIDFKGPDLPRILNTIAQLVVECAGKGLVSLRYHPVRYDVGPPEIPELGLLNLIFAEKDQPLVDAFHATISPEPWERQLLKAMDGSRSLGDLEKMARGSASNLDMRNWIGRLARRGTFRT